MSLLSAVLPADYAYVVAVGTVGVYSVLQYATIKVSGARKAAGVKCALLLSHLHSPPLPSPDSTADRSSFQTLRPTPRTPSPSATSRQRSSLRLEPARSWTSAGPSADSLPLALADCAQRAHSNTLEVRAFCTG